MNGAVFLVLIAVIGSALSIVYYLKLIISMFFHTETTFKSSEKSKHTYNIIAVFIIVAILTIGIYPDLFKSTIRTLISKS